VLRQLTAETPYVTGICCCLRDAAHTPAARVYSPQQRAREMKIRAIIGLLIALTFVAIFTQRSVAR
jgi:hypothetical protein